MKKPRVVTHHPRDMDESTFSVILADLVARVPGARAAALVDREGETVDYGGEGDPYEMRVAAAIWQIALREMQEAAPDRAILSVVVRAAQRSFIVHLLPEAYAVVVLLRKRAGFTASARAFVACERSLCEEAGWSQRAALAHWFPVDVTCDARGRPRTVEGHEKGATNELHAVEVLGALVGSVAARKQRGPSGFRVRLESGAEATLVREPGGSWYSEDKLSEARVPPRRTSKNRGKKPPRQNENAAKKSR